MKKLTFVLIISSILAIVLAGCSSGLGLHDKVTARQDIKVTIDFNTGTIIKPTCVIAKGALIEVTDFSSLSQGSSESIPLIELSSQNCTGWAFNESGLASKIKK